MTGEQLLEYLEARMNKMMRSAKAYLKESGGDTYAEMHDWLQQFAVGYGLDIAAGNFPTMLEDGSSHVVSVDGAILLGNVFDGFRADATRLTAIDSDSCDFVLCNYFDAMPSPLVALLEWHRVLKPGGVMALVVPNVMADRYMTRGGPLSNSRKLNCFCKRSLHCYMERAGLKRIEIEEHEHLLRARGYK